MEIICVLTFNKGNKVWFQQTINANIEYSETPKHVVIAITPGILLLRERNVEIVYSLTWSAMSPKSFLIR